MILICFLFSFCDTNSERLRTGRSLWIKIYIRYKTTISSDTSLWYKTRIYSSTPPPSSSHPPHPHTEAVMHSRPLGNNCECGVYPSENTGLNAIVSFIFLAETLKEFLKELTKLLFTSSRFSLVHWEKTAAHIISVDVMVCVWMFKLLHTVWKWSYTQTKSLGM